MQPLALSQAMSKDQNYRPRSPDLSGLANQQPPPRLNRLPSLPHGYSFSPRGSYDASPFFSPSTQQPVSSYFNPQVGQHLNSYQSPPPFAPASLPRQQSQQNSGYSPIYTQSPPRITGQSSFFEQPLQASRIPVTAQNFQSNSHSSQPPSLQTLDDMARLRQRKHVNYNENQNGPTQYEEPTSYIPPVIPMQIPQPQQQFQQPLAQPEPMPQVQPSKSNFPLEIPSNIDVKTKFPVARIKRIMQADEDVGKVAQATPTAVSKALEMFIIALVVKGAAEAKQGNSKRVTATHLKTALLNDEKFDFLNEICETIPDEGGKKGRSKSEAKSEHDDVDSDDSVGDAKKKGKSKKRKGTSEAESD